MIDDLIFSRPMTTALRLGNLAPDRHLFPNKKVLLTGEAELLKTANGRVCLITSLLLLIRINKKIEIFLPSGFEELRKECNQISERFILSSSIKILLKQPDLTTYDAILSIGSTMRQSSPWTVINSNGWLARVSSGPQNIPPDAECYNPIAALAAACLGTTEIFKRLIRLKESRGRLLDATSFSLYSYKSGEDNLGPALPERIAVDILLTGVGAIGNGILKLLCLLPITGNVRIVDYQKYEPENLGTCLVIGPSDLGKDKALFAEEYLDGKFQAKGFVEDIREFRKRLGTEIPYPKIILNGLDNIDARHYVQDIWPDVTIDGAIGDFGIQVSRHSWSENSACLKCLFRKPTGEASEIVSSRATGLSPERIHNPDDVVTDKDIAIAPAEKKEWLQERRGRKICSIIQDGIAQQISNETQRIDFEPSVPFVACLSASMVVAELIKQVCGWETPLDCRFQFDALIGPVRGEHFPQLRRKDCVCVTRRHNIETIREHR